MIYEVWKKFSGQRVLMIELYILILITNMLSLALKYINKITFDRVFYDRDIAFLFDKIIYVIIGCMIVVLIIGLYNQYLSSKLYTRINIALKETYYEKILYSVYLFLKNVNSTNIYYRMFTDFQHRCLTEKCDFTGY